MKPRQPSAATIVTSPQQRALIAQLGEKHLDDGGIMLAQVFADGLRVRVLTADQAIEIRQAMSKALGEPLRSGLVTSAFQKEPE